VGLRRDEQKQSTTIGHSLIQMLTFLIQACTINSGIRQIYSHTSSSFASKECLWNVIFLHIFLCPIKW